MGLLENPITPEQALMGGSKTLIKMDKPYSVSSKHFYLNKNDRMAHSVGHSQLK